VTDRSLSPRLIIAVPSVLRQLRCVVLATGSKLRLWDEDGEQLLALPRRTTTEPRWTDALRGWVEDRGEPLMEVELSTPQETAQQARATLELIVAILDERVQSEHREDEICSELVDSYEHLGFFYGLGAQLGGQLEPASVYGTVLRRSAELLGAHRAALILEQGQAPAYTWEAETQPPRPADERRVPLFQDGSWLGTLILAGGRELRSAQDKKILQAAMIMARLAERQDGLGRDEHAALLGPVRALAAAVEAKHPYRRGHARRVATLARSIGEAMDLDTDTLDALQLGGLLHDLGMAAVHDAVMSRRGSLTVPERQAIQDHTTSGADILASNRYHDELARMVRHHHERWDGKGYPDGLAADRIPLNCRILAVADAVDAMLSRRTHRPERSVDEVRNELEAGAGNQFDPQTVRVFIDRVMPRESFALFLTDLPWVTHDAPTAERAP